MPLRSDEQQLDDALEDARLAKIQRDKWAGKMLGSIKIAEAIAKSLGEEVDLSEFYEKPARPRRAGGIAEDILKESGPLTFDELQRRIVAAKGGNTKNEELREKFAGTSITQKINRGTLILRKDGKIALP